MKQTLRYGVMVGGAIGSILLFLLASASDNSGFFDRYYSWLLGLNAAVAAMLVVFVVVALWRLYSRYRAGKFGSRLMSRLVLLFGAIGILPGLVIFVVSVQFVSHSIDSWFDVKIEAALKSGLNLGVAALDQALTELGAQANVAALTMSGQDRPATQVILNRVVDEQDGMQSAMLVDANGVLLASSSDSRKVDLVGDLPTMAMLKQATMPRGFAQSEGGLERDFTDSAAAANAASAATAATAASAANVAPDALDAATGLRLRVVLLVPDPPGIAPRYLQLLQSVPVNLATNAEVLRNAYSEYQTRFVARLGLRKMYIETLSLTLLLAIFGAIASAFLIASNLAQPLLVLAEGTRAVAEGDLSPRPIVQTRDELGTLTQSFNTMTGQLFEARSAVERNRADLQSAKAHLESVLANMSAGVLVLDAEFIIVSANDAAERILMHASGQRYLGRALHDIDGLGVFADAVTRAFSAQSAQTAGAAAAAKKAQRSHWQREIEIPRRQGTSDDHDIALLARGSRLPVGAGNGYIVVFDDISDVISAQRSVAWGEVARRLAHEIKNPLTPIQLSAERLQMKLEHKVVGADLELLNRATNTIVHQVDAMKRMVDDFRDYAKAPPAVLEPLHLNGLIRQILDLYLAGDDSDIIHVSLARDLPAVMGDATQLRQVIHNLLQNAQDAMNEQLREAGAPPPRIDVSTETIHFDSAEGGQASAVRLAIVDNGPGFAPKILSRAFEPYVTSKARGTGLGLPMVKKIIDEHGGRIDIHNRQDGTGAAVLILLLKLAPEPASLP
ncbi:ATP-binding protein [Massilia sp. PWRC2]|uniref:sensor histidine kinase n=1 Tax=Massilia sp. PWRC2 TaxID=2804626 RepID=UPI003CE7D161